MLTASTRFKDNAKAPVKTTRVRFIENVETTPITITSEDDLISAKIENVGSFLGTSAKKLTIKAIGIHDDVTNRSFRLFLDIQDPTTDEWDSVDEGLFNVMETALDYEANSTTITLWNAIYTASITLYSNYTFTYPMTVSELASEVANKLSCTIATGFDDLPNADHVIPEDLYALMGNVKLRDVIDEIAKTTGTTALARGSEIHFVPFTASVETLTSDNLKTLKIGKPSGVINSVVLSRQPQNDDILLKDEDSIALNGLTEFKIINNEIMDDDRSTMITPLFDALNGVSFYGVEAKTEGHGWYEIGDVLSIQQASSTFDIVITDITLVLEGSITEIIKCVVPDPTKTDYTTAGGILKSIYNTEIKTDRQAQEITSIVSRQDTIEATVIDNYSEITQTIDQINTTIQTTGGNNLIKNSVGYSVETDGTLTSWTKTGTGTVGSISSPESISYGAKSGSQINISGVSPKLVQRVYVQAGGKYSLSFRVKKDATGSATVKLTNTSDNFVINILDSTAYLWNEMSIIGITATLGYFDIEVESVGAVGLAITDIMLNSGELSQIWQQAYGEILNTQVTINDNGMRVKSSVYVNDYTEVTSLGFAGYSDADGTLKRVFFINRDTTELQKLSVVGQITMPPIKIVPITSGANAGWAFVKVS